MQLQSLVEQYGYLAVFAGCFFEGETVLVLASFAAHLGYLSLPWVIGLAAAAGFCGDQTFFFLGRRYGRQIFDRWPYLRAARPRVDALVARYGALAAFGIRFAVGLRLAGPIAIGASGMRPLAFALPNALGAIVWAGLIAAAGYAFGAAFTRLLERAQHVEAIAFAVLAIAGVLFVVARHRVARRRGGSASPPSHGAGR